MSVPSKIAHDKSVYDLAQEALRLTFHSAIAVSLLAAVILAETFFHGGLSADELKTIATALAFLVPALGGLVVARWTQNSVAGWVWVSGLLFFALVCLWVLDLPTGRGLCEGCGAAEKLHRTIFSVHHGSGLLGGDGLLIGSWVPLSMIGYAVGARVGLR